MVAAAPDLRPLLDEATAALPSVVDLRRRLHHRPEIGLDLPETQQAVLDALAPLGLDVILGRQLSSVVAVVEGRRPGPAVLLRADMDALPLHEDADVPFASAIDGAMHACGHDAHTAMLVGAAGLLTARRAELAGSVVIAFQPGEEGFAGARLMLDEGLLDVAGVPVAAAFALHQSPNIPSGTAATRGGPLLAATDEFDITVRGRGGHASMPHHALDPIPIACELVQAIQTLVTRQVDAFDPAVVTVTRLRAGTASNIVPESARLGGTVRTVSERTRAAVLQGLERLATGLAAAHGATAEVTIHRGYPVTVNDHGAARRARTVAASLLGEDRAIELDAPVMGAEDFAYVLDAVPGAMVFLGTRPPGVHPRDVAPNHSNRMLLDEDALAAGTALYAALAMAALDPPGHEA